MARSRFRQTYFNVHWEPKKSPAESKEIVAEVKAIMQQDAPHLKETNKKDLPHTNHHKVHCEAILDDSDDC